MFNEITVSLNRFLQINCNVIPYEVESNSKASNLPTSENVFNYNLEPMEQSAADSPQKCKKSGAKSPHKRYVTVKEHEANQLSLGNKNPEDNDKNLLRTGKVK